MVLKIPRRTVLYAVENPKWWSLQYIFIISIREIAEVAKGENFCLFVWPEILAHLVIHQNAPRSWLIFILTVYEHYITSQRILPNRRAPHNPISCTDQFARFHDHFCTVPGIISHFISLEKRSLGIPRDLSTCKCDKFRTLRCYSLMGIPSQ